MHTPHLDQLAAEGRLFNRHYVQVPTCGASRFALLLGQYPQLKKHTSNEVFRDELAAVEASGAVPLPRHFRANGYRTISLGKISHYVDQRIYTYEGKGDGRWEMPGSWDEVWGPVGKWGTAWNAFFAYADGSNRNDLQKQASPTEFVAEKDEDLPDGLIARKAVETLQRLQEQPKPFFLAVGFLKPHLPFVAPQKYWELYRDQVIPLSPNPEMPTGVAPMAIHQSSEMFNNYRDQPEKGGAGVRLSDAYARHLRQAYFAAVSYVDAQVGKLLQALQETGLDQNTIVVVWGDHGWHLGDHTVWGKHTLFERSLRSAFLLKTPGMAHPGQATNALVETVDIYPTLLELCQIPLSPHLSGQSLVPVLRNPTVSWNKPALGFWKAGYTMRTPQYRLTKYKQGLRVYTELYDHYKDPHETVNVAGEADYREVLIQLERQRSEAMPGGYWSSLQ